MSSGKDRAADSPTTDLVALQQEKDQKIARLTDELTRLQAIHKDSERKNNKIGKHSNLCPCYLVKNCIYAFVKTY